MSTILKALRKLEREREEEQSARRLGREMGSRQGGHSTDPPPGVREGKPRRRPRSWHAIAGGLLAGSVAYAILPLVTPKPPSQVPDAPASNDAELSGSAGPRFGPEGPARRGRPRGTVVPETASVIPSNLKRSERSPSPTQRLRAAPVARKAQPRAKGDGNNRRKLTRGGTNQAKQRLARAKARLKKAAPAVSPQPSKLADSSRASDPSPDSASRSAASSDDAKSRAATAPASARGARPARPGPSSGSAKEPEEGRRASEPVARNTPKPRRQPSAPSSAVEPSDVLSPVGFPPMFLESVRWHPNPERRVVRLEVERGGPFDLREGDIVAGVLIERIRPAAIEVRLGGHSRIVGLEP